MHNNKDILSFLKVWFSQKPSEVKIENVATLIKESKLAVLCISDAFAEDEKCVEVFELVKNIIRKNYQLIELGTLGVRKWSEYPAFASVCSDFRIIMQDQNRYVHKLTELLECLERQIRSSVQSHDEARGDTDSEKMPDVFISYAWSNSADAVTKGTKPTCDHNGNVTSLGWLDPRSLAKFFKVVSFEVLFFL